MEVGNKLRSKLLMATGGEEASPLEQEIRFLFSISFSKSCQFNGVGCVISIV